MAAPAQSPLRRWKRFFGAFDSVDAAIEAADPVLYSRGEFRRARGGIFELLCNAADDDQAERLCLVLDDVMAESLETLRLIPAMPTVLAYTDLAKSVRALRKHESERVRVLASGIISAWRASVQDDFASVRAAHHKLDNVPQPKEIGNQQVPDATTKQPVKITETSAKNRVLKTAKIVAEPPLPKIMVSPPAGIVSAGLCSEEKMEAAKRKFRDGYKEAEDAKRQRRTIEVVAPEMLKQRLKNTHRFLREGSRARCASSMVKKTFHRHEGGFIGFNALTF